MSWLPDGFEHPERVDLPTGRHLRPIRAGDAEIDHPAGMGSPELERALDERVPRWLGGTWGFTRVHYHP
jgi:hypothetical protein